MKTAIVPSLTSILLLCIAVPLTVAQQPKQQTSGPLYRVTVVERTVKAVNYQYRSEEPTLIDFRGTVLLPQLKGEASVDARQGRTEIDAKLSGFTPPQRFGPEYMTYVLWAITPEGAPHNIAELIPDSSGKVRTRVTTDLLAFALIVTAELYSAVRQPSDVVVAENEVRPDTVGKIVPVDAKLDLLQRGQYTWHVPSNPDGLPANAPKISGHEYDALTELYQAQNAVNIAASSNAERYAPETFARARQLLADAQQLHDRKADFRRIVQSAREAAQTAEDARVISDKRQREEQYQSASSTISQAQAELSRARQEKERALEEAQLAQSQADAAIAARERVEAQSVVRTPVIQAPSQGADNREQDRLQMAEARKRDSRARLLAELKGSLPTLDSSRGLVATISYDGFRGAELQESAAGHLALVATILSRHPDLHITVEGHS